MSNLLSSRKEFVAALEAEWYPLHPGKPIYYQNGPQVDPANEGDLSLHVYWQYNGAELGHIGQGATTGYQYFGDVMIDVSVPEGTGMNKTLRVMDELIDLFKARSFASFFVGAPVPLDPIQKSSRCLTTLRIPISSHIA